MPNVGGGRTNSREAEERYRERQKMLAVLEKQPVKKEDLVCSCNRCSKAKNQKELYISMQWHEAAKKEREEQRRKHKQREDNLRWFKEKQERQEKQRKERQEKESKERQEKESKERQEKESKEHQEKESKERQEHSEQRDEYLDLFKKSNLNTQGRKMREMKIQKSKDSCRNFWCGITLMYLIYQVVQMVI